MVEGYKCRYCGEPILESMGFMDAGDMDKALKGELDFKAIRVTCGRCDMKRFKEELMDCYQYGVVTCP